MIQILDSNRKPSFGRKFSNAVGVGLQGASQLYQQHQEKEAISKSLGPEAENLPRDFQKMGYQAKLNLQQQSQKLQGESAQDEKSYGIIKDTFGEKFANVWKSSPTGARTELLKAGLEGLHRGQDIKGLFDQNMFENNPQNLPLQENFESEEETPIRKKTEDFDKGLTPAERTRRQESRYKTNLPLYKESQLKMQNHEAEKDNLGILENLSPQIGGLQKLNIDPRSGDLIIPEFASPEAQQYVKTVNDFTRNAKDSYGSRVTNFDIQQFMKRLPTLANSEEGRAVIIDQLQTINDINLTREKALHDVINEHGGIRNIDFDKAEQIARKRSEKDVERLRKQFRTYEGEANKAYDKEIKSLKDIVPKGKVGVERADGSKGYIDKDKVEAFLKIQGNKVL